MTKRILVAVDTTENATAVLRAALDLARFIGAKVRLFHAVPLPINVPPPGVFAAPRALDVQDFVAAAKVTLQGLETRIPEDLRDGICVDIGHPAARLCELAHNYNPDIVVIGAHDYGPITRALGTTAARIVNRMDRPVFVVRPMPTETVAARKRVKTDNPAHVLERLLALCDDGAAGYRCAAGTVKAPDRLHRSLLRGAAQREETACALRAALVALGREPSHHGSLEGAAHRRLLEALAVFAPDAPDAIRAVLRECQRGERKAIKAFSHALVRSLPKDIHDLVQGQLARVLEANAALDHELLMIDEQSAVHASGP